VLYVVGLRKLSYYSLEVLGSILGHAHLASLFWENEIKIPNPHPFDFDDIAGHPCRYQKSSVGAVVTIERWMIGQHLFLPLDVAISG
jgi:hypothetical protein